DIQLCPANSNRAFVLTSTTLFWIEISPTSGDDISAEELKIAKLYAYSHERDPRDESLRLAVHHRQPDSRNEYSIVNIYSSGNGQIDVCWFSMPKEPQEPRFHHQITFLPRSSSGETENPRTICIVPTALEGPRSSFPHPRILF